MESNVMAVGKMEVVYTVEPDKENEGMALVCYWDPNYVATS